MSEPTTLPMPLLQAIARGGKTGNAIATAICDLIKHGALLGELEEVGIVSGETPRTVCTMPRLWLERLTLALQRGAFERMEVKNIVARILIPPEAALTRQDGGGAA